MLERQDIDALLVGALYGELSSTEQAQLTAHLESHPADRSALDDLKAVRERFTSSRIFEVQLEPPQSVSALLLQEAARRAPKQVIATDKKESWFDRFVRSFIAHPAMAAAATLVLVLGVAGTIYLNGGSDASQPRVAQSEETISKNLSAVPSEGAWGSSAMNAPMQALDPSATPPAAPAVAAGDSKRDSVQVALDEDKIAKTGSVSSDLPSRNREQIGFADGKAKQEAAHHGTASAVEVPKAAPAKAAKGRYVEVPKEEPQPKDFENELQDSSGKDVVAKNDRAEASRGAGPGGGGAANGNYAAPAGTIAQQSRPTASPPPPPAPVAATSAAEPPTAKPATKPDASLAWAKDQHARIIALVKDGKCSAAVPLAATLKTRAPDYYATNVATDRALKSCMQYVNDSTTERAAEKKAAKATDSR